MNKSGYSVALVGATGLVGQEILTALDQRTFPVSELRAFATLSSLGSGLSGPDAHARGSSGATARRSLELLRHPDRINAAK